MFGLWVFATIALAQDACPAGQVRSEFTLGNCCWPGQAWNGKACVGIPRCPEGMKTLPDRCVVPEPPPRPRAAPVVLRNVVFAGSEFSGQVLSIDGEEAGKLPNAFELPLGEHVWAVHNGRGELLLEGAVKIREGEGDQVVMVRRPAVEE
ncbi:MAG: hypothetical protein H6736_23140 [Alphaproteobacteria bacterium]|nr:hypothetical protein [Alphaproteobacteria bacterium]MCB9672789.1 hypothetical protein [Alphaproteobacteria bacterium]MCB9694717.1 hypothetical protein [Alphaproteobacteria bacterium]